MNVQVCNTDCSILLYWENWYQSSTMKYFWWSVMPSLRFWMSCHSTCALERWHQCLRSISMSKVSLTFVMLIHATFVITHGFCLTFAGPSDLGDEIFVTYMCNIKTSQITQFVDADRTPFKHPTVQIHSFQSVTLSMHNSNALLQSTTSIME